MASVRTRLPRSRFRSTAIAGALLIGSLLPQPAAAATAAGPAVISIATSRVQTRPNTDVIVAGALGDNANHRIVSSIVELWSRPASSATWRRIQTTVTNGVGHYTFHSIVARSTVFQTRYLGSSIHGRAQSVPITVGVATGFDALAAQGCSVVSPGLYTITLSGRTRAS